MGKKLLKRLIIFTVVLVALCLLVLIFRDPIGEWLGLLFDPMDGYWEPDFIDYV